ncbi:Zn-dependent protease with chaperone function [Lysinibacillus fusiformis]|uniref:Zn-dependent protease with chaperone function n=2 Tax=Lysinibacillus fusiformis TaxID=28031 RepID=A0A1H9C6M1_9BACI|nr:M48 family metallopeptidase [Lysinibacillus fusiformis]SCY00161.1 Zn-dependent protease with chaperone function [Lysinibacillus fusiformis]SEN18079.1 Zn-dependent protease with chaperone function [Lysinibacillus fusiformis]SEP96792.1 Zn-dependent protease with chaperone function [Lysinibacillus fusiformis]
MGIVALLLFGVYVLCMYWYIFHSGGGKIPSTLQGTVADPVMFMSGKELLLSGEYSKIRNFLFFVATPLEWLVYFMILLLGVSRYLEKVSTSQTKWKLLQNAGYLFLLSLLVYVALFPMDYYRYYLSKSYGISNQAFGSWMKDGVIDFWVNFGMTLIIVTVLYWLIKKSEKRWWLYAWLLTIPFTMFVMFIQPVVIDPLYNDFYPLKNKELETKILSLATEAHIPAEHVYEVNMSEKTNALNAYVTGIGSNSRIVLWDTTLNRLTDNEILFIMAHEMGHYVEKHIYFGIAGYLLLSLAGLWLTAKIMRRFVTRYGQVFKINKISNISSYPLFLLITSILLFASNPVSNYVSRYQESRADQYAIDLMNDRKAAVTAFQKLTISGLSEVNPPLLVKWFRYTHPPMLERINNVADKGEYKQEGPLKEEQKKNK